jgi:hypothetical protein
VRDKYTISKPRKSNAIIIIVHAHTKCNNQELQNELLAFVERLWLLSILTLVDKKKAESKVLACFGEVADHPDSEVPVYLGKGADHPDPEVPVYLGEGAERCRVPVYLGEGADHHDRSS